MTFAIQTPLRGIIKTMTARIAMAATPKNCQTRTIVRIASTGTSTSTVVIEGNSCSRWASTAIRLTTSPTFVCLRAADDKRRLC